MKDIQAEVREAKQAFKDGKKDEAFTKLAVAWAEVEREFGKHATTVSLPFSKPSFAALPSEDRQYIENVDTMLRLIAETVNAQIFGIDPNKYAYFKSRTPNVTLAQDGRPYITMSEHYDEPEVAFQACVDILIEFTEKEKTAFRPPAVG